MKPVINITRFPFVGTHFRKYILSELSTLTDWLAELVEYSLSSRKVVGLFPGMVIAKTSKMEPVAFSHGAQHKRLEAGPVLHNWFIKW